MYRMKNVEKWRCRLVAGTAAVARDDGDVSGRKGNIEHCAIRRDIGGISEDDAAAFGCTFRYTAFCIASVSL